MDGHCQDLSNDVLYTTTHLVVDEKIKVSIKPVHMNGLTMGAIYRTNVCYQWIAIVKTFPTMYHTFLYLLRVKCYQFNSNFEV